MAFLNKLLTNVGETLANQMQNSFLTDDGEAPDDIIDINSIYSDGAITYALDEQSQRLNEAER